MKTPLLLVFCIGVFTGCATSLRVPGGDAHIKIDRADSARVWISRASLKRDQGNLLLTGSVMRVFGADNTTQTHLTVRLFDAAGKVLREVVAEFEPRDIPRGPKLSGWSEYRVVLDPLPPAVARLEVRAYEGDPP